MERGNKGEFKLKVGKLTEGTGQQLPELQDYPAASQESHD
jgi:hypothetical protein